jgi:hypothetical protein
VLAGTRVVVVLTMGNAPGVVGDEEQRVQNRAENVVVYVSQTHPHTYTLAGIVLWSRGLYGAVGH